MKTTGLAFEYAAEALERFGDAQVAADELLLMAASQRSDDNIYLEATYKDAAGIVQRSIEAA